MPITDLTGYTWVGNVPPKNSPSTYYNINYVACEYHWTSFSPGYYMSGQPRPPVPESIWFGNDSVESGGEPHYIYNYDTSSWGLFDQGDFSFTEVQNGNVIQITGGTDATNPTLIAWLEANGTLTAPVTPQPMILNTNLCLIKKNGNLVPVFATMKEHANLISFKIGQTNYQAEEGMTWDEWVDSEYNTGGYSLGSGTDAHLVVSIDNNVTVYIMYGGNCVYDNDVINNVEYYLGDPRSQQL